MPETIPAGDPGRADAPPGAPSEERSDPELIAATRDGDTTAYAVLYERHVHAARRLARVLSKDSAGADDLVSETFAKLLHTFREGRGPDLAFRPYMLRTLRNTFYDRVRRDKRVEYTDDLAAFDPGETFADPAVEGAERRYAALAFGKLPERWRMVLWHTEVEEDSPAQIAAMLGMTANGVAALAYRAREKLRQNYLTEHAADAPPEQCRWTVDRLGARVRGKLGDREAAKVDAHLDGCVSCNLLFAELTELNSGLRGVLAPVILGATAAPYLAASAASAAGIAVGGALGVFLLPFKSAFNWVRRLFQQLGTKGGVATGTAAAVVAAAAIFALTSGDVEDDPAAAPDPPGASQPQDEPGPQDEAPDPPDAPDDPDAPAPGDPPDDPDDPDAPADPAEPGQDPAADDEEPEAPAYQIGHALGTTGLVAGGDGVLPILLSAPAGGGAAAPRTDQVAEAGQADRSAPAPEVSAAEPARASASANPAHPQAGSSRVTLDVALPPGIALAGDAAEPGWRCQDRDGAVRCTVAELPDPARADIPISIDAAVTGYQTFVVTVEGPGIGGTTELRIPVAPAGSAVAYASLDATGVTAAGNALLTCSITKCQDAAQFGLGDRWPMSTYQAPKGHPQPPSGRSGAALSGAVVEVPSGATVVWAGLYWAGVDDDLPTDGALAGPGGTWRDVSAAEVTDTRPGAQAFADVTALVAGGGEYWFATDAHRLPTSSCAGWPISGDPHCLDPHWAGWSLTVVYAEPGAGPNEVAVYDGAPSADTAIGVRGGGEVTVAHTLWGGSAYRGGDEFAIGGTSFGAAATCFAHGALNNPHWYAFGVDVAVNAAHVGESGTIRYEQGRDDFIVGVVAVAGPAG